MSLFVRVLLLTTCMTEIATPADLSMKQIMLQECMVRWVQMLDRQVKEDPKSLSLIEQHENCLQQNIDATCPSALTMQQLPVHIRMTYETILEIRSQINELL